MGGGGGSSSSRESSEKRSSSDCVLKSAELRAEKSEFLVEKRSEYRSSEQRSDVGAEKCSLESARGNENETKSRLRIEKGSEVGTDTWSFELALATAIEKSEWKRSFDVEFAREKSEESQLARMEKRSTLTELERGMEDLSDSEFLENLPSLESESLRRRCDDSLSGLFISRRSSTLLDFMISFCRCCFLRCDVRSRSGLCCWRPVSSRHSSEERRRTSRCFSTALGFVRGGIQLKDTLPS